MTSSRGVEVTGSTRRAFPNKLRRITLAAALDTLRTASRVFSLVVLVTSRPNASLKNPDPKIEIFGSRSFNTSGFRLSRRALFDADVVALALDAARLRAPLGA